MGNRSAIEKEADGRILAMRIGYVFHHGGLCSEGLLMRGALSPYRNKKLPFRGVFLQRRDQNTVLTEPPYFFSMKSLTSLLVSAFMSFWSSGRFSSPSRTATIFAYGESEPSL